MSLALLERTVSTNFSVTHICSLSPVSVCNGKCCHAQSCQKLDPADCIHNVSTLCDLLYYLDIKINTVRQSGLLTVVADMFLDKHGKVKKDKTKADVLLITGHRKVQHVASLFDKVSTTLSVFSKMMKIQIIAQTMYQLQGIPSTVVNNNKDDKSDELKRHLELRESQFTTKFLLKMAEKDIVSEIGASIFLSLEWQNFPAT